MKSALLQHYDEGRATGIVGESWPVDELLKAAADASDWNEYLEEKYGDFTAMDALLSLAEEYDIEIDPEWDTPGDIDDKVAKALKEERMEEKIREHLKKAEE